MHREKTRECYAVSSFRERAHPSSMEWCGSCLCQEVSEAGDVDSSIWNCSIRMTVMYRAVVDLPVELKKERDR